MSVKYREHKGLNLPNVAKEVLEKWKRENTFEESVNTRDENKPFVFFEQEQNIIQPKAFSNI